MNKSIKLNLGCGWRDFGAGWIHIDGGDYDHLDSANITCLPYENNSVDLIYASHVLAYFDQGEAAPLLKEWRRVLKPEGTLRLAVPNFEAYTQLYQAKKITLDQCLGPFYGKMEMGEGWIYHKTVYDFDSLKALLEKLDFTNIREYNWRQTEHSRHDDHSQAYIPHMDKTHGTLMSLNMECLSP